VKEGSRNRTSLSAGALLGKSGGGAPLLRIWKDMGRRAQRTGISQYAKCIDKHAAMFRNNTSVMSQR